MIKSTQLLPHHDGKMVEAYSVLAMG